MALDIQPVGRFGMRLHQAIDAKKLTLSDVAAQAKVTYEHIRKLIRQEAHPSEHMLEKLSKVLGLDLDEITNVATADKIQGNQDLFPTERSGNIESVSEPTR
jgi:transcriptional regulator with XRE-family HTH domain